MKSLTFLSSFLCHCHPGTMANGLIILFNLIDSQAATKHYIISVSTILGIIGVGFRRKNRWIHFNGLISFLQS